MINEATTIVTTVKTSHNETTAATAVSRNFHNEEDSNDVVSIALKSTVF